jgi:membrane protease YdiL (CAAX protease family)
VRPGARFCGRCGAPLADDLPAAPLDDAPTSNEGNGLAIALGTYFVVLAVILVPTAAGADDLGDLRVAAVCLIAVGAIGCALHRGTWPAFRPPRVTRRGAALVAAVLGATLTLVLAAAARWPWLFESIAAPYRAAGLGFGYLVLDMVLLPAVGEELLFRGVILTGLRELFRTRTSVVVSALLFASIHLSPISFLHLGALGVVLAEVRLRTGSLFPCVLIHGAYNGVVALADWLP